MTDYHFFVELVSKLRFQQRAGHTYVANRLAFVVDEWLKTYHGHPTPAPRLRELKNAKIGEDTTGKTCPLLNYEARKKCKVCVHCTCPMDANRQRQAESGT